MQAAARQEPAPTSVSTVVTYEYRWGCLLTADSWPVTQACGRLGGPAVQGLHPPSMRGASFLLVSPAFWRHEVCVDSLQQPRPCS